MAPIRVALVDGSAVLRQTVRFLLSSQSDFHVTAEAEHGIDAVTMVREHRPDVVLMSISTKFVDAINVCKTVTTEYPKTKVLLWSANDCESVAGKAIQAGASAVLRKGMDIRELMDKIRTSHSSFGS